MALFRAVETAERPGRRLFEDPYAIPLLSGMLKALAKAAQIPRIGRSVRAFLDFGWPYTRSSGVVRTRLIDDLVRDSVRSGAEQFVLLGAGFDSRAFRLDETRHIRTFEVDHPATQRAKRERLKLILGHPPESVRFVEVDFETDDLELKLREAGFDQKKPAVVLWEGVVSYLSEVAVNANLNLLSRLLAPHSRLILTYVDKGLSTARRSSVGQAAGHPGSNAAVSPSSSASIRLRWPPHSYSLASSSKATYPRLMRPRVTSRGITGSKAVPSYTESRP